MFGCRDESEHKVSAAGEDNKHLNNVMASKSNDSSQVKACLCPDEEPENVKPRNDGASRAEVEPVKTEDSGCGHSCSSTCGASCTAAVRRRRVEGRERPREEAGACCPLQDLKRLPQCRPPLGELRFGRAHTVLVDVRLVPQRFVAQDGRDVWSSNVVKMPCSPSSSMVKSGWTGSGPVERWKVISKHLGALSSRSEADVADVQKAIMKYNPKYEKQWLFDSLASFVKVIPKEDNYLPSLFPKMAALALKLPEHVKKAIPLLSAGRTAAVTLSQVQISCLLANAFFCTFPHRNACGAHTEYWGLPSINFTSLFGKTSQRKRQKLRAIMQYFKEVTDSPPRGLVTFERRCLSNAELPDWTSSKKKLLQLHVTSQGSIEDDGVGMLQVDFAASLVGGGVLNSGLLQEEILFLIHPELIVSRLFTERLGDNECLIITGCQKFSIYSGFGDRFEWVGPCVDSVGRDEWFRLQRQIVAMDALHFKHPSEQYDVRKVQRELNKAYCGFKKVGAGEPDVATGKWGCGAFNGEPQLKALIQLMAAAEAGRGLAFFTFRDEKTKRDVEQMYKLLVREDVTVGQLYALIQDYCRLRTHGGSGVDLLQFITLRSSRSQL
ncbi:poly(ADP-ribose) glycohydrolase isoform X2 [Betta splendens]|uniref:poly(ADP-ribose) glycohydrolase n=1 Tax=Betta splendens TaxID=158456 RepID=A0A9W2Y587_BETSP|nr:poly(ADP-ribose) glycohydrolase isoform X2 [Betta splendens]